MISFEKKPKRHLYDFSDNEYKVFREGTFLGTLVRWRSENYLFLITVKEIMTLDSGELKKIANKIVTLNKELV